MQLQKDRKMVAASFSCLLAVRPWMIFLAGVPLGLYCLEILEIETFPVGEV